MAGITVSRLDKFQKRLTGTFSMVARCPKTSALGVCVSTAVPAGGAVVPYVKLGIAAIATQGYTNVLYGLKGLKLIEEGLSPDEALNNLLNEDAERELRQVAIIDSQGRKATFTGSQTTEWKGHIMEEDCIAAGNALVSGKVLDLMVEKFNGTKGWLAERLMQSLEMGDKAGGDRRGKASAALLVADKKIATETRPLLNLRVDLNKEPVKELRKIFDAYKKWIGVTG